MSNNEWYLYRPSTWPIFNRKPQTSIIPDSDETEDANESRLSLLPNTSNPTAIPQDWLQPTIPTASVIESTGRQALAAIIGDDDNNPLLTDVSEVGPKLLEQFKSLCDDAEASVHTVLNALGAKVNNLATLGDRVSHGYAVALDAARRQYELAVLPLLPAFMLAKAKKTQALGKLKRERTDLPSEIAKKEFALTGDPSMRVNGITKQESEKFLSWVILITMGNIALDMFLASSVFVGAASELIGYSIGLIYAGGMSYIIHQRAVVGRIREEYEESAERHELYLKTTPRNPMAFPDLPKSATTKYHRANLALAIAGGGMILMRLAIAFFVIKDMRTSTMAIVVTAVMLGLAYVASDFLKKFAPAYGNAAHETIGQMKERLEALDRMIAEAEEQMAIETPALKAARDDYNKAIAEAKQQADAALLEGDSIRSNILHVQDSYRRFQTRMRTTFLETALKATEIVCTATMQPNPDEEAAEVHIDQNELEEMCDQATKLEHNLLEAISDGSVSFTGTVPVLEPPPTADAIIMNLEQTLPPPTITADEKKVPIRVTFKKSN